MKRFIFALCAMLFALCLSGCASKPSSSYPWADPLTDPAGHVVQPPAYSNTEANVHE